MNWHGKAHPAVGGATPEPLAPGCIQEQVEQAMKLKSVSITFLWCLLQFLPSGSFRCLQVRASVLECLMKRESPGIGDTVGLALGGVGGCLDY